MRRLARTLATDENAADDLEQEAWLAATQRPPGDSRSLRGWLATVLRRAATKGRRSAKRRTRREEAAARPEAVPAAADVVAEAELHARVVRAVLDLDEPLRTAVLLRYFENLPPRLVGDRTGVSAETARARVRRGVELMRERFDREHGGVRAAWVVAMAGLAEGPAADPPPARGVPWTVSAGVLATAGLVLLGAAGFWRGGASRSAAVGPGGGAVLARASDDARSTPAGPDAGSPAPSTSAGGSAGLAPRAGAARPAGPPSLTGRVTRASDGSLVAGIRVVAVRLGELLREEDAFETATETDGDGRYTFARLAGREVMVLPRAPGLVPRGLAKVQPGGGFNPLAVEVSPAKTAVLDVALEPAASVVGRVVDAAGAPVAGARVSALLGDGDRPAGPDPRVPSGEATSGADGGFTRDGLAEGTTIRVRATAADQRPTEDRLLLVRMPRTDLGTLEFPRRRWVDVTVLDANTGTAVPDADVVVSEPVDRGWRRVEGGSFRSDTDGRVRAGPLPEGRLQIAAARPPESAGITSNPAPENVVDGDAVVLHVSAALDGRYQPTGPELRARVVGPDGTPVPRAWFVDYVLHGRGGAGIGAGMVRDGAASLGWSSPRTEWVEVYAATTADGASLGLGHTRVRVPAEDEFEMRLGPERFIRGRVLDAAGRALGGARVTAFPAEWASILQGIAHPVSEGRTDEAGGFVLGGLGDGEYRVVVAAPRELSAGEAVAAAAGTESLEIRLHRREVVRLEVLDAVGAPVRGATAELRPSVDGDPYGERIVRTEKPIMSAVSGPDGIAELADVDAAVAHRLRMTPPAGTDLVEVTIDPWRASENRVRLSATLTIRGVVRDAQGRPLKDMDVDAEGVGRVRSRSARTAQDGTFTLQGLTQGRWTVRARDPYRRHEPRPREAAVVEAGAEGVEFVIDADPVVDLRVELEDVPRGRPTARLLSEDDDRDAPRAVWDATGLRFTGVTPTKTYSLFVGAAEDDLCALRTAVRGDAGTVRVARAPGLTISGTVTAPQGAERVTVWLGAGPNPAISAQGEVGSDGRYLLRGLPPGRYHVSATAHVGGAQWRAQEEGDAGKTLDLVLKAQGR